MLVSLISLSLVFTWTSEVPQHSYCALQTKASEIPLYHTLLWALQCCLCLCSMLLIIIELVSLHSLQWLLSRLSCILLIMNCLSTDHMLRIFKSYEANVFVKVSFIALSFQLNCLRTSNKLSLGGVDTSKTYLLSRTLCYCFSSKLVWFGYN